MKKQKKRVQIAAIIAFIGIILSIIGTGVLVLVSTSSSQTVPSISQEELEKLIQEQEWEGVSVEVKTDEVEQDTQATE